jgi:hypothetical protein
MTTAPASGELNEVCNRRDDAAATERSKKAARR